MAGIGTQKQVPPPVGGLNARDAITSMPPEDALVLDNIWVEPTYARIRRGSEAWATGIEIIDPIEASRYMRIIGLPVRDGWYAIAELQAATSPGGPDIVAAGTVSSADFPGTVSNIDDGNSATEWIATLAAGWTTQSGVVVDFGSAVLPVEVRIQAVNTTAFWRTVRVFAVHLSNDPTFATYQVAGLFPTGDWTQNQIRTFTLSPTAIPQNRANARCWRVRITANNGNPVTTSASEFVFASTPGGASIMTGGSACQGYQFSAGPSTSFVSDNLFDNNTSTFWAVVNSGPTWAGYLAPGPVSVAEVRIACRNGSPTEAPLDGAIEWSNNLLTWNTVTTFSGLTGWVDGVYKTVAVP